MIVFSGIVFSYGKCINKTEKILVESRYSSQVFLPPLKIEKKINTIFMVFHK